MSLGLGLFGTPLILPSQKNLITVNPGFESDLTAWNFYSDYSIDPLAQIVNSPVRSGTKALKFGTTGRTYVSRNISIVPKGSYKFGCYAINTATPNYVDIYVKRAVTSTSSFLLPSSEYIENSIYFIATGTDLECGLGIDFVTNSQSVYVDDFFLYKL